MSPTRERYREPKRGRSPTTTGLVALDLALGKVMSEQPAGGMLEGGESRLIRVLSRHSGRDGEGVGLRWSQGDNEGSEVPKAGPVHTLVPPPQHQCCAGAWWRVRDGAPGPTAPGSRFARPTALMCHEPAGQVVCWLWGAQRGHLNSHPGWKVGFAPCERHHMLLGTKCCNGGKNKARGGTGED